VYIALFVFKATTDRHQLYSAHLIIHHGDLTAKTSQTPTPEWRRRRAIIIKLVSFISGLPLQAIGNHQGWL
jgi:hypothetical protein